MDMEIVQNSNEAAAHPLSKDSLKSWIDQVAPGLWSEIEQFEAVEDWAHDCSDEVLQSRMEVFLALIEQKPAVARALVLGNRTMEFVKFLAHIKTSISLKLLNTASRSDLKVGDAVLSHCRSMSRPGSPTEGEAKVVWARMSMVLRVGYYKRVFGESRRKDILEIMRSAQAG